MSSNTIFSIGIDADGFCWQIISSTDAIQRLNENREVYALYEDGCESLVESVSEIDEDTTYGIELGFITTNGGKRYIEADKLWKQIC